MRRARLELERRATVRAPATGVFRCGGGRRPIAVPLPVPTAGYGPSGHRAHRIAVPLEARALVFEARDGGRAAVCVLDAMSASRWLWERVAARTAALGVGAGELVLAGTHTHTGPGGFYGNALYDLLACTRPGFRAAVADAMADAAALAVADAAAALEPAAIGLGTAHLFGVARQASLEAFARNPESAHWHEPGYPGQGAPREAPELRAVDGRVRALAAFAPGGRCIAALATFGAHATALGQAFAALAPDWPGIAREAAAEDGELVLVAVSNAGDINVTRPELVQGEALAALAGTRIGKAMAAAIGDARERAAAVDLEIGAADAELSARRVDGRADTELAPWAFGQAALAGGADARSPLFAAGLVEAFARTEAWDARDPASPKRLALGRLQGLLARALALAPSPVWPLHLLRLGPTILATVPGEPTVVAGLRIERALARLPREEVMVLGCAGDYAGYFTTPEEYEVQGYEGASTLFGRHSSTHLAARLAALGRAAPMSIRAKSLRPVSLGGRSVFETWL